jgi:hypothetical protein
VKVLEDTKKLMRAIKDAWDKNLAATAKIMNRIDECFTVSGALKLKERSFRKVFGYSNVI